MHIGPFLLSGTDVAHPYLAFRIRLARHGLAQFIDSIRSLAVMAFLLFSQMLLATIALIAFPPMYFACTGNWLLLLGYGLALALPCHLLRQRLLPADVVLWLRSRPVTAAMRRRADLHVAAVLMLPLAVASAVSAALIFYFSAPWLRAAPALSGLCASLALGWLASACSLGLRQRGVRHTVRAQAPAHGPLRIRRAGLLHCWRLLYWAPFWRLENSIGLQQCALFAAAVLGAASWMWLGWASAIVANIATSALLVIVTDRGDQAVREQQLRIAPALSPWPRPTWAVHVAARMFSALPALAILSLLVAGGIAATRAGVVYLIAGLVTILLLVAPPAFYPRARPGIVLVAMVALMAAGSELP